MDSVILLAKLHALERQIAEAPNVFKRALAAVGTSAFTRRRLEGVLHLHAIQQTSEELRDAVLGNDDLGSESDSLSELSLRAIRLALLSEFDKLATVIEDPCASDLLPAFGNAFFSCGALRRFVDFQLSWQIRAWNQDRAALRADRPVYRGLLRRAEASLVAVRARLSPLLTEGAARADWPALADICRRMRDVLAVRIEVEPDHPILPFVHLGEASGGSGVKQ